VSAVRTAAGVISVTPRAGCESILGFAPAAVILWWSLQDGEGAADGNRGGLGFVACQGGAGGIGWVSQDGIDRARTATWTDDLPVLGLVGPDDDVPSLRAHVELSDSGFTLLPAQIDRNWQVHYFAVGGAGVQACAGWCPVPAAAGPVAVALDLPAPSDLVLLVATAAERRGKLTRGISVGLGAASRPRGQVSTAFVSPDGVAPGSAGGAQRADRSMLLAASRTDIGVLGRVTRWRTEGMTIEWETGSARPGQVLYLAVSGVRSRVGSATSPPTPATQRTRIIGMRPRGLLCFSWGLAAAREARDIGRVTLGGASSTGAMGAVSWDDRDTPGAVTATHVRSSRRDVLLVPDTQTGGLHAAASLRGLGRGGFTLEWTRSDGPRRQFHYVALGDPYRLRIPALGARLRRRIRRVRRPSS
jgi:hypothetical protein